AVGEDLSWYWKPWFFEFGYPDLAIKSYELKDGFLKVEIERKGNLPVPIKLSLMDKDNIVKDVYYTADVWKTGNSTFRITVDNVKEINKIVLGSPKIPDSNKDDNEVQIK
ncbi:MAG: M1 family metallopeptidase, partial [Ignavibacterium sp.]